MEGIRGRRGIRGFFPGVCLCYHFGTIHFFTFYDRKPFHPGGGMELNVVVINLSVKSGVSHSLLISLSSHSLRKKS